MVTKVNYGPKTKKSTRSLYLHFGSLSRLCSSIPIAHQPPATIFAIIKGQGRVLGSSSSSSGPTNPILSRPSSQTQNPSLQPRKEPSSVTSNSKPKPLPQKAPISYHNDRSDLTNDSTPNCKPANGFDPFDSMITFGKRSQNRDSLNVYECPICGQSYRSEEEVSIHVDTCFNNSVEANGGSGGLDLPDNGAKSMSELECCIGAFVPGKPSKGSIEVVLKLKNTIPTYQ